MRINHATTIVHIVVSWINLADLLEQTFMAPGPWFPCPSRVKENLKSYLKKIFSLKQKANQIYFLLL